MQLGRQGRRRHSCSPFRGGLDSRSCVCASFQEPLWKSHLRHCGCSGNQKWPQRSSPLAFSWWRGERLFLPKRPKAHGLSYSAWISWTYWLLLWPWYMHHFFQLLQKFCFMAKSVDSELPLLWYSIERGVSLFSFVKWAYFAHEIVLNKTWDNECKYSL